MANSPKQLRDEAAGGTFCIVPYCHPDFAWTHHREWHEERYAVSTCDALDLMSEHERFRFCMEPWIDHVQPFLERCPDRVEELRRRLNSRQMGVKAFTLTSPRPATCPDETFLRNMILGRRKYSEFAPDADLSVMACPDVGIGHSQMPQVVKLAGAAMYRGWRSDSAFSYIGVPREFIWRGLDGSEIITSRGCYGGLIDPNQVPDDFADRWDEVVNGLFAGELAKCMENSHIGTWWVAQGMDDARPLRAAASDKLMPILELVAAWNEREAGHMVLATPNEYRERLQSEDLPPWDGVIDQVDVAYNSGWHGQRGLWRLRQQMDTALVTAERACALARLAGATNVADAPELEELWVEAVRIASHALQWVFEKDWEWINSRAGYALRQIKETGEKAVAGLSGIGRSAAGRRPIVLFNPLPYPREEIVQAPWVQPRLDVGGHAVFDADGAEVPVQLGEQAGELWGDRVVEAPLIFRARVPAMGCAVYEVDDKPLDESSASVSRDVADNGKLQLQLSQRGLQSVTDPCIGLCWQAPLGSCIGDCRLFEMGEGVLHIGPITGELSGREGTGQWVLSGPLRWVYRWETQFHGQRVRQDVILDDDARHIDFITRVFCSGANGFFALCFDMPIQGQMHVDVPFGVEPRDLSDEPYAMDLPMGFHNIERHRKNQMWARTFASISDGNNGLTLITADGDKYWTWDAETGQLRHILFTPLRDVGPAEGWEADTTKDRLALGWHEFRHRLVFHAGDWRSADMCRESDRLRMPLQVVKPLGEAAEAGACPGQELLAIQPANVRLSAFHECDEGYVLRVYESAGVDTEAAIRLPAEFQQASCVDLNLAPMDGRADLEGDRLVMQLAPWQIATVLLAR